ncbi:unnamed protein product [Fraxinus pennsylvanica]|uniref:Uncharacterized protein n=1 Tax=Fraxinus pennsylvanica TaxID=56036 RepID=A0AAD1ZE25_9LAMI|nr:unnamed protein product [Fraxinus pennsylvanica]
MAGRGKTLGSGSAKKAQPRSSKAGLQFPFIWLLAILMLSDYVPGGKVSAMEEAFNRNLLGSFLLANILTGLVNLSIDTLLVPPISALAILFAYGFILSFAVGFADFLGIKLEVLAKRRKLYMGYSVVVKLFFALLAGIVFKFDPPNDTTFPHSVYLLPNFWSFQNCDLRRAKKIAQETQGGGEGFEFVLKRWQPYYFACGERNGFHCKTGMMKFAVSPFFR